MPDPELQHALFITSSSGLATAANRMSDRRRRRATEKGNEKL
jgi:hypothetical protein